MKKLLALGLIILMAGVALSCVPQLPPPSPTVQAAQNAFDHGRYTAAVALANPSAQQGDPQAQTIMGLMRLRGLGLQRDDQQAAAWFGLAARHGYSPAQYQLALLHENGQGVTKDDKEALRWYLEASRRNYVPALTKLGAMCYAGRGMPRDLAKAAEFYVQAARLGDADAQLALGDMYKIGVGGPLDYPLACYWYRKAAERDQREAQLRLSEMYFLGQGVLREPKQGLYWLTKSAESGYEKAQLALAERYLDGRDVPQDSGQGMTWLTKAAERGYPKAQRLLALLYWGEQALPKDREQFMRWLTEAAQNGDALSQTILGLAYLSGDFTPMNPPLGVHWIYLAAERGNQTAQLMCGGFELGAFKVRSVDLMEAYKWLRLATDSHDEAADDKVAQAVAASMAGKMAGAKAMGKQALAGLTLKMKPEQLAEAQRRVAQFRPLPEDVPVPPPPAELLKQAGTGQTGPMAAMPRTHPGLKATGTGFVVSEQGHVLTNLHVVKGAKQVRADGLDQPLTLVATDAENDLALLKLPAGGKYQPARFRVSPQLRAGEGVVIVGHPLAPVLGKGLNVTTGTLSSLTGPSDNSHLLQVTAQVQDGNSGSPLLDEGGLVIGVVTATLSTMRFAELTGSMPQNLNLAVHGTVARVFLESHGVSCRTSSAKPAQKTADIAEQAGRFVVLLLCYE